MITEKNVFNETPIELLKWYDLMYFLTDSENPNEYCPIEHPEKYIIGTSKRLITSIFSNTHLRRIRLGCF